MRGAIPKQELLQWLKLVHVYKELNTKIPMDPERLRDLVENILNLEDEIDRMVNHVEDIVHRYSQHTANYLDSLEAKDV